MSWIGSAPGRPPSCRSTSAMRAARMGLALAMAGGQIPSRVMISVLLPVRNASATLPEALASLHAQRGAPPVEIVCVDDASTDGTPALLGRDARIKTVRGEGRGLVAALNLGLSHCRGDLIARMDADDVAHPDRLRLQAAQLEKDHSLGAVGSLIECFPRPLS